MGPIRWQNISWGLAVTDTPPIFRSVHPGGHGVTDQAGPGDAQAAQNQLRAMIDEIRLGLALKVNVQFGPRGGIVAQMAPPLATTTARSGVWPIPAPLGKVTDQSGLPPQICAAILVEDKPPEILGKELIAFLSEYGANPFLRPVFLSESMAPLPLLARYGFVCFPLQGADPVQVTQRIAAKFAVSQLRALSDGRLIWGETYP